MSDLFDEVSEKAAAEPETEVRRNSNDFAVDNIDEYIRQAKARETREEGGESGLGSTTGKVPTPEETKAKADREEATETKKEFVRSFVDPEMVMGGADLLISKGMGMATGVGPEPWELDDREFGYVSKMGGAVIKEEKMDSWPAWVWLVIIFVVIYVFKALDVFKLKKEQDEANAKADTETASETPVTAETIRDGGAKELDILAAKMELAKEKKRMQDIIDEAETPNGIPPSQKPGYVYDTSGQPVFNKDGTHKKHPGDHAKKQRGEYDIAEAEVIEDDPKED